MTAPADERRVESSKQRFVGLCVPPLVLAAVDAALTLTGQSAEYWGGEFSRVNEGSPTFNQLLQVHPAAFVAGCLVWYLVFAVGILLLPRTLALVASLAITTGHTAGAASWLFYRLPIGYQLANGLFLASAILTVACMRWGWLAVAEGEYRLSRRHRANVPARRIGRVRLRVLPRPRARPL